MIPLLMTTMMRLVAPSKIGQAMGLIGMVISAAPAAGPTVSGLILNVASWRWLFWLILPIGIIALVIGLRLAPAEKPACPLPHASRQHEVAAASSGAATHLCACLAAASRWQARG